MTDQHDIAGPVLAHFRREHDTSDGTLAWPAGLTEDEQVAFMQLLQARGDTFLGIIAVNPDWVRRVIATGDLDAE